MFIGEMPFLWLTVDDAPGPDSMRALIERNSIALLSNFKREALDRPSETWLGRWSGRERVRDSGLWNNAHVDAGHVPEFLDGLDEYASRTKPWEDPTPFEH